MKSCFHKNIGYFVSATLLILVSIFSCNQKKKHPIVQEYQELYTLFINAKKAGDKLAYSNTLLQKAKQEKDTAMILAGYRMFSVTYTDERVLLYSDSIIALKKNKSDNNYPAIAYEKKGDFYYDKRVYKLALDNYLKFSYFAKKHNQEQMIYNANYNIGVIKRRTENLKEALELYQSNYAFTKQNKGKVSNQVYLNSITAIANVYNDMEEGDSASYYNKLGYKEAIRLKNEQFKRHFAINEGISKYYQQKIIVAIDSISKHIPYFENLHDYDKLSFAYYYNGEAYWKLDKKEIAIEYFKKVDTAFQKTQSLFPKLRKAYVRLDEYYKEKEDAVNQLQYKNQLTKVDSILNSDEFYLSKTIFKEYEIPKLQAEKETILAEKQQQKNIFKKVIIALVILLLVVLIGFSIQYKKRKIAQKRFQEAIKTKKRINTAEKQLEGIESISVPAEVVEDILAKLEVFEAEKAFISNQITLSFLARELNTNPNYLSKIVNHFKKSSFSSYINNLRIEYAIEQLKTNPTYLKYTIKAIASEVGFNNVQSFSKAFLNSKGINPSYFIRELKKSINQKSRKTSTDS